MKVFKLMIPRWAIHPQAPEQDLFGFPKLQSQNINRSEGHYGHLFIQLSFIDRVTIYPGLPKIVSFMPIILV